MDFDIDRWIGRSEKPNVCSLPFSRGRTSQRDSKVYDTKLQQPIREPDNLYGTIVAVLDRDSRLRHEYLIKRWRGVTGQNCALPALSFLRHLACAGLA
jgi:hypothetical protein